jgi:CIC family chloride channel protein
MMRFQRPFHRFNLAPDFRLSSKLLLLSMVVGIVAGLGATVFFYLMAWGDYLFMAVPTGYVPPLAAGEHFVVVANPHYGVLRWLILILPAVGGLVSGLIVYRFAPEAEGDGTDAVAEAFHQKRGIIPSLQFPAAAVPGVKDQSCKSVPVSAHSWQTN